MSEAVSWAAVAADDRDGRPWGDRGWCDSLASAVALGLYRRSQEDPWLSNRYAATSSSLRGWAS